jgi:DNA replication protein DnaD
MKKQGLDFTKKMPYVSRDLVDLYNHTSSGHFFDKDTMRFFKSRLTDNFKRIDDKNAYFITTEKGPMETSKRMATIRKATIVDVIRDNGNMISKIEIDTVGDFNKLTLARAVRIMRDLK